MVASSPAHGLHLDHLMCGLRIQLKWHPQIQPSVASAFA